jgi:isopenicillin N synthase-like dioxygenase
MASLHTDQSLLTTQWFESHPGLVVTDYHGNKIEYNYKPGKVIVFWGKKALVATKNTLRPLDHYVDSRAQENRNSGIYFVHTQHESVEVR